ncbi:PPOX class probable FMN-dependent enzyme, DR_2398 family [Aeromicrobium marinum DSM 15272]|uniref:PPOX class probable FMN-dependent enzyme, DR_2398 family n=1 Tax=Aeromicrobium marinum DSM 15272 TaxID=585531 RepID=E2SDN0_9ACTN|nr:pyridoxamine 5'-phosphate oxidase family protein [Aeromicrobium marinum]EFQ82607.1 PPOX class probable FMN-dependent enzyme, DR_2398 family [Aeromicrobium marinum DSM 15272]
MATEITTPEHLRELLGTPLDRVVEKDRDRLHPEHRAWLAASPFCLVATSATDGTCDVSPKGDPAGSLVHVVDDATLAIAERPGNRRADGFLNLLQNPRIGLLFCVPGRGDTLRVNGRARLLADAPYAGEMTVRGHRPVVVCEVTVEQVFFHCAKALLRSELWEPQTWRPDAVPSRAEIARSLERPDDSLEDLQAYYGDAYRTGLY